MSADRHASPPGPEEMETLRGFLHQRLAAAVDDILGEFGRTVARYREQIDRQRRQLHGLRSEERSRTAAGLQASSWIKPEEPDGDASPAQIKTEVVVECGAAPEPNGDFGPAGSPEASGDGPEAASGGRPLAESSDTEDSGDYRRETAGPREPKATEEGASSAARSRTDLSERRRTPPPFGCKVCGESFRRRSRLLTHAAAHLRDCGLCGRRLEPTESLQRHLRGHEEAAFRCSVCGQSFTLRGNLRTHMRIHSGERPHGCTVCGKSFGRRATLVRHVRSHTGEKPFACAFCGRGFVEKGNLTVHLRTHTGERPYRCSGCDRRFSQRSCFYKHLCQRRDPTM